MKKIISILFLLTIIISHGQKPSVKVPDLDTDKKPFLLKFSADPQEGQIFSSYAKGKVEGDSLFFKAKIAPIVERVMVTVLLKNKNESVKIDIVKKHWKDVKKTGETRDGVFQMSFDTADEFGIIITSSQQNVAFDLAVWRGGEMLPKASKLFYQAGVSQNDITSDNSHNDKINELQKSSTSSSLLYIIIAILVLIAILLIFLVSKKRKTKVISMLLFFFLGQNFMYAEISRSTAQNFNKNKQQYQNSDIKNMSDFVNDVRQLVIGEDDYSFLNEDDINDVANNDYNGQPSLPSSCLDTYNRRDVRNDSDSRSRDNEDQSKSNSNSKINNSDATSKPSELSTDENEKLDRRPGKTSNNNAKEYQLPIYDKNGNLKSSGDFPNAPERINPTNTNPTENPFIEDDVTEGRTLRQPKYDELGGLVDYGDFPEAPLIIDMNRGIPSMNPFIDGTDTTDRFVKQPSYDEEGNLVDSGDFPDAPPYIKPSDINNPFTGEVSDERIVDTSSKKEDSESKESDKNETDFNKENSKVSNDSNTENQEENRRKKEGCDCLKAAYLKLDKRRFNLEKLKIIASRIKRQTDYAISFGDNVSGVHAVSGLAWQSEKKGILESLKKFDNTYKNKYNEMMNDLDKILIEIDRCESLLGFENWYEGYGSIYFTFMQDKYKK